MKVLKGLGSIAAAQMQAMKIAETEIIASSKVDANMLGDFHAAFISSNFEYSERSYIDAELDFKGDENDERKQKHSKPVESVQITHETSTFSTSAAYTDKIAAARATEYSRQITNLRGTHADPDYMESLVHNLVKDCP